MVNGTSTTANNSNSNRIPFDYITSYANNSGGTPMTDRISSSFTLNSLNFSRRSAFNQNNFGGNIVPNIPNENNTINNLYYKNFEN